MEHHIQDDINVLIKRRFEEYEELLKRGVQPFKYSYDVNSDSADIIANFKDEDEKREVSIAGRIMTMRRMGKA